MAGDSACRREAYADPHVRALIGAATPSTNNSIFDKGNTAPQGVARAAVQQATLDCMRRRGLALPGGVEPVRHYDFSPLAY
ncbi:MAG TPA: hypothetical protein VFW75_15090 [Acetobacteraceae bacterium]|nr:hypothetical protein [Acetobacteraceae bacterium]